LAWPLGQPVARAAAAASGPSEPGTVARAAPAPGWAGSRRDDPSTRSGTSGGSAGLTGRAEPVAFAAGDGAELDDPSAFAADGSDAEPSVVAGRGAAMRPETVARPLAPPLVGALAGGFAPQSAPGAGGGGGA